MEKWQNAGIELLQMCSDWLWTVNREGQLIEWRNPSVIEKNEMDSCPPQQWSSFLRDDATLRDDRVAMFKAVRDTKPFRFMRSACVMPKSNVRGWLRISGIPNFDKATHQFSGYYGVALNITGQMMASRKLERMDMQTRNMMLVMDASPLAIFLAKPSASGWTITYANAGLVELSGLPAEKIMGQSVFFLMDQSVDIILIEMLKERMQKRMQTKKRLRMRNSRGEYFWAEVMLVPGHTEGPNTALVGIIQNVDQEMQMQSAEAQRARLHALGELAGGMAHEINNLLLPACLNSEILLDEISPESDQGELIKGIQTSLNEITYIVRNTLRFARKDDKNAAVINEEHPLASLLEEKFPYIKTLLPSTLEIKLEIEEQAREGSVNLSPTHLLQTLTNLCTNASHAMNEKGAITIVLKKIHLDGVSQQRESLPLGQYFLLSVTDTGHGIEESVLEHIFDPFYTTKPIGQGTGLGLSVVYGLVTQWGGSIRYTSKIGVGTTAWIYIPVVQHLVS